MNPRYISAWFSWKTLATRRETQTVDGPRNIFQHEISGARMGICRIEHRDPGISFGAQPYWGQVALSHTTMFFWGKPKPVKKSPLLLGYSLTNRSTSLWAMARWAAWPVCPLWQSCQRLGRWGSTIRTFVCLRNFWDTFKHNPKQWIETKLRIASHPSP